MVENHFKLSIVVFISIFSHSTSFIISVMFRMSVATISDDAAMLHMVNSVRYSVSLCPGQCSIRVPLIQPWEYVSRLYIIFCIVLDIHNSNYKKQ